MSLDPESPGFSSRPVTLTQLNGRLDACLSDFIARNAASSSILDHGAIRTLEERVKLDKTIHRKPSVDKCEKLFFYYAKHNDFDRLLVAYLDYREAEQPPLELCRLMMNAAGANENANIVKTVLEDLFAIKHLKWDNMTVLICLKTLSVFGMLPAMLRVYERMYRDGHLPSLLHWCLMLRAAAKSGCPKTFSRFHHRLQSKGFNLTKTYVRTLLGEWGSHDDLAWRTSKDANLLPKDYASMIKLAQRYRNYELAIKLIQDIYKIEQVPTILVYEVFADGVSRDFPAFRLDAREWRLKWRQINGVLEKQTRQDFEAWVSGIASFVGEGNLSLVPLQPVVRRPQKRRQTVKERLKARGRGRKRVRYTSSFTNDNLFEMVPEYMRRMKFEEDKKRKAGEEALKQAEVQQNIDKAMEARKNWEQFGFKMNYSVDDSLSTGPLPRQPSLNLTSYEINGPDLQPFSEEYLKSLELPRDKYKKPSKKRPTKGKDRYRSVK